MALNNFNPVLAGMFQGVQIASQIQNQALQKRQFNDQRKRQDWQDQITEIGVLDQLDKMGRPVENGQVSRPGATMQGAIDPMTGQPMQIDFPGMKSAPNSERTIGYKTRDGRSVAIERFTPQEKLWRDIEVGQMMNQIAAQKAFAEAQAKAAGTITAERGKRALTDEDRQLFGVPVEIGGRKINMLPNELGGAGHYIDATKPDATKTASQQVHYVEDAAGNVTPVFFDPSAGSTRKGESLGRIGKGRSTAENVMSGNQSRLAANDARQRDVENIAGELLNEAQGDRRKAVELANRYFNPKSGKYKDRWTLRSRVQDQLERNVRTQPDPLEAMLDGMTMESLGGQEGGSVSGNAASYLDRIRKK
jgi:hypothetical protein